MTRQQLLDYCKNEFQTVEDYPFEDDFTTAALRHRHNRKWYALLMNIPKSRLCKGSNAPTDVVNLKLPTELQGSFSPLDGVYPAYHMNKLHWISVILSEAQVDTVKFLVNVSHKATK